MYVFFMVPIMAYIMKGGEDMNGIISKSKTKTGTFDFGGNPFPPPLVDLIQQNVFFTALINV